MLRLENVTKIYPTGEVLKDVSWEVKPGMRVGLVGPNGSGKTTQFKIICGKEDPTSGQVVRNQGLKIGYLCQEFDLLPDNTVQEEFHRAFVDLNEIQHELDDVHKRMETAQGSELNKLIHRMDDLHRLYETKGGYLIDGKIEKMLVTMGFDPNVQSKVREFSGGWQMRINFGKVLLTEPDLLLLDEPTNHIDLETIEWLEKFLLERDLPLVMVSHDRHFLDRLCTTIIEMEKGVATQYLGNYSQYIEARAANREAQQAAFERQSREMEKQQAFVDRFRASATRSTQAKSREKQLEKIELIEAPEGEERTLEFRFPEAVRSGVEVAVVKGLTHAYDDKVIFLDASLHISRGDRIAILGPNGSGKSTLLKLLTGSEPPMDGLIKLGEHNVKMAYFEQNQAEALDLNKTVLDTIYDEVPGWKTDEVRGLLGRFLFSGDAVFKNVGALSGGEKARLALAKMLLSANNFLILDEPTNHLDIPAKETLEAALKKFDGTVVVVSHDRYFISQVANKVVEIKDGQLVLYHGGYEYYLEVKEKERLQMEALKEEEDRQRKASEKKAQRIAKDKARQEKQKPKE